MIHNIQTYFERQAFGVCSWWGDKLRMSTSKIRLFFIYFSFLTFGSPLLIYLVMAFILSTKTCSNQKGVEFGTSDKTS